MNLYENKNMETGQIVASTVLLKEAAKTTGLSCICNIECVS